MARKTIQGITIEIGGDTTKLQDALKGVENKLKDTQFALKDVNKLLKLDPGNVELLTQKQKLLGDSITHGSWSSTGDGYRSPLWCALTDLGYKVDFVGTQTDSSGRYDARLGDPDHEGISGIMIKGMLKRRDDVFDKCGQVDCVLLHIGSYT